MISFVYFDVGGVVIQDFSETNKWYEFKHDLGIPDAQMKLIDEQWKKLKEPIDKGDIHLELFEDMLRNTFHISIPKTYSMLDDFVNRFEKNPSIWPVIQAIQKTHRIGLLTNMFDGMVDKIESHHLFPPVVWNTIVDSSVVHMKKPDKEIFKYAQEKTGVPHKEIFFIDNKLENIEAAKTLDWQTYLYDSKHPEYASKELQTILL